MNDGPDGLDLAEGIEQYIELFRAQPPSADLDTMRLLGDLNAFRFDGDFAPHVRTYTTFIAAPGREIPVKVFDPGAGRRAAICYFHGGGFALGSSESFSVATKALASAANALVISVHYRRLPEADYASAQDDCDQAFAWMVRQAEALDIDPDVAGVAGDSAGALLALACAANARDGGGPAPAFQMLFYGAFSMDANRPQYTASRDMLTHDRIRGYIDLFRRCGGLDRHPAPLDRPDLAGLPPTHVVAAEHDPLRDEAAELAEKLAAAGVRTSFQLAAGMIHGFLRAAAVSGSARAEIAKATDSMRQYWTARPKDRT